MPLISQSDVGKLQSLLDWQRQVQGPLQGILGTKRTRHRSRMSTTSSATVIVQAPEGGILARSGGTCQSALCKIVTITGDPGVDAELTIDPEAKELQVYNYITIDVLTKGDRYGQAILQQDGRWWAISDDCHDGEEPTAP